MYEDINIGNATVCGSDEGWRLPGGKITKNEPRARMIALRMSKMMRGLEVEK